MKIHTSQIPQAQLQVKLQFRKFASKMTSAEVRLGCLKVQLEAVDRLRDRVRRLLKHVINLHIEIMVLEANVNQMLDDVKHINADILEVQRLDTLINTLRDYNGPTICHEWPFPLMCYNSNNIDQADLAQILNTNKHSEVKQS